MRTFLIAVAMVAGVAVTATVPAAAQRPQVNERLRVMRARRQLLARLDTAAQRYQPTMVEAMHGSRVAAIGSGAVDTTDISLAENRPHVVLALCDGCGNLDIQVFGPDGAKLGEDVAPNATPVVEFTSGMPAPGPQRYRVLVRMAGCSQPTCDFGIQVMGARMWHVR